MTKIMTTTHDLSTNKVTTREMTENEYEIYNQMLAQDQAALQAKLDLETAKAAAQAKLEALGLTLDDLKALGL